jgi:hypothetical protein
MSTPEHSEHDERSDPGLHTTVKMPPGTPKFPASCPPVAELSFCKLHRRESAVSFR